MKTETMSLIKWRWDPEAQGRNWPREITRLALVNEGMVIRHQSGCRKFSGGGDEMVDFLEQVCELPFIGLRLRGCRINQILVCTVSLGKVVILYVQTHRDFLPESSKERTIGE